ncbi:hypothetical protein [Paenibacillus sp. IITD108]
MASASAADIFPAVSVKGDNKGNFKPHQATLCGADALLRMSAW